MSAPRFYLDIETALLDEALSTATPVTLTADAAHHAGRALRLCTGEGVSIFNGSGKEWRGVISFSKESTTVALSESLAPQRESPLSITLVQALVAPEKMDWIAEKAVELGVSRLVLVPSQRSVTKLTEDRAQKRLQKLEALIVSAAEQCGRNTLMAVDFIPSLEKAFKETEAQVKLVFAPGAQAQPSAFEGKTHFAVAIGAEGGFSEEEIALAQQYGWTPKLLGPRVMRTETAGLAAAVWLNTLLGDFQ